MHDAEFTKRIDDRVDQGRRRTDRTRLAGALDAERVGATGHDIIGKAYRRHVLGAAGVSAVYEAYDSGPMSIFELGSGGSAGASDVAVTSLLRHGNFDYVTNGVIWSASISSRTLPASLYRQTKPGWWPSTSPWPWAGSDLIPMVGTLPAKDRSDHL